MLFLITLLSLSAQAEERAYCGPLNGPNDVIECVKSQAPVAQALAEERDAGFDESKAATRWLNPQLYNQTLLGKSQGNDQYDIQVAINQTFEFGPKRSYKYRLAESLQTKASAEYTIGLGEELIQTGKDLLRLSQLQIEIAAVQEAVGAFTRLIGQFSGRPRLSPEQSVTLSVYRLSKGDFKVRENQLLNEQDEIYHRFKSRLNLDKDVLDRVAVVKKVTFPAVNGEDFPENTSPEVRAVEAGVLEASAALSLARSDVFSEIQIGPMVQFQTDGPYRSQLLGFQVTMPLPFWNQNGYGIQAAAQRHKAAEKRAVVRKDAVREEWKHLIENYGRLRKLLEDIPEQREAEANHRQSDAHISRGLVNSALVVESHRSLIELQKSRHSAELEALASYWHILIIQGKISEIRL